MKPRTDTSRRLHPLSSRQKAVICQLAAKAYAAAGAAMGYGSATEYRRAVVFDTTGKSSLTQCNQKHYTPLYNAFAAVAGLPQHRDNTPVSDEQSALVHIREIMQRFELNEAYVRHIIADRLSLSPSIPFALEHLVEKLVRDHGWKHGVIPMFSTLTNRGRELQHKAADALGLPHATEHHAMQDTVPPARLAEHLDIQGPHITSTAPTTRHTRKECHA